MNFVLARTAAGANIVLAVLAVAHSFLVLGPAVQNDIGPVQVCAQLQIYADNVALPVRPLLLLLSAGRLAID